MCVDYPFFFYAPGSTWDISPAAGIEPRASAVEAWRPNHWAAGNSPQTDLYSKTQTLGLSKTKS